MSQNSESAPARPQLWVENEKIVSDDGKRWVNTITPIQRQHIRGPWTTWGNFPNQAKGEVWNKFMEGYNIREGTTLGQVKELWKKKASKCYNDALKNARKRAVYKSGTTDKGAWKPFNPKWLSAEIWHAMVDIWIADPEWDSKSRRARENGSSTARRRTINLFPH